jgi:hypothetical protein
MEEWRYISTIFDLGNQMDVVGQIYASADLPQGKQSL